MANSVIEPAHFVGHSAGAWDQLTPGAAAASPDTLRRWEDFLHEYGDEQGMYECPEWSALLAEHAGREERAVVAVARAGGAIVGVAPLHLRPTVLEFAVAGRTLYRCRVRRVSILGGRPLMPPSTSLHDGLFAQIHAAFPDAHCVSLSPVPTASFLWRYLRESAVLRRLYVPRLVVGPGPTYRLPLPSSFREYLAALPRKRRYNLGREVRLLQEHSQGSLALVPVDSPETVPGFLEEVEKLAQTENQTWIWPGQTRISACQWITAAARRGFLCSYLLRCHGEPVAAIVGFRYRDTCVIDKTLYSRAHARFSPGTVLMHLAIEALIERGVRLLVFGFGNPSYGNTAALVTSEAASVVLWRRGLANWARRAAHDGFQTTRRCARRLAVGIGVWPSAGH